MAALGEAAAQAGLLPGEDVGALAEESATISAADIQVRGTQGGRGRARRAAG
jgi:hypothetical protein